MVWGLTLWETFACESVAGGTNRPDGIKTTLPDRTGGVSVHCSPALCL